MKSIAERLKWARERRGLSQAKLGESVGVKQGAIANIESGTRRRPREIVAIAAAVGVTPRWLESGVEPRFPPDSGVTRTLASDASAPRYATPFMLPDTLSWGDVLSSTDLPPRFVTLMPDDALMPSVPRGTRLIFERGAMPAPGLGVLVQDSAGGRHVRRYAQGHGAAWVAQSLHPAYTSMASDDGAIVLAVLVGRLDGSV